MRSMRPGFETSLAQFGWRWAQIDPRLKALRTSSAAACGCFAEFVRRDEGILARIGLWPKQWSAARMFGHTAKGFHVHPPSVPEAGAAALFGNWPRERTAPRGRRKLQNAGGRSC